MAVSSFVSIFVDLRCKSFADKPYFVLAVLHSFELSQRSCQCPRRELRCTHECEIRSKMSMKLKENDLAEKQQNMRI